jgi:hypothetical protein
VAHALRRALVGTLALASIAIAIPVATALTAAQASDAPGPTAGATSVAPVVPADAASDRLTVQIQPAPVELVPPVAPPSDASAPTRNVRAAAAQQLAGPPPSDPIEAAPPVTASLATRQLLAAGSPVLSRAEDALEFAEPELDADLPVIAEPPFPVTLGHPGSPPLLAGDVIEVTISFYYCEQGDTGSGGDGGGFCGPMRDGTVVYEGAAACALTYLGQQFRIVGDPTGRTYTCHDTGNAVLDLHRDIFFHKASDGWPWLWSMGTSAVLEIVR